MDLNQIFNFPKRTFNYIDTNYGLPGIIIAGLAIVMSVVMIYIMLDRRK